MDKSFFAGIYATSPCLTSWDEVKEANYIEKIKENLPHIRGLELPYWGTEGIHPFSDDFFLKNYSKSWDFVLTCIPGNMKALATDPHFGLASCNLEGRKRALRYYKKANEKIPFLEEFSGRNSVPFVQIVSSPSVPVPNVRSSWEAFSESLEEILSWDWHGAKINVEHCDSVGADGKFVKGFLTLGDEIKSIQHIGSKNVGIVINWGRSAIEAQSIEGPLSHIVSANTKGMLRGIIFSGTCEKSKKFGSWKDNHAPINFDLFGNEVAEGSLLNLENIQKSLELSNIKDLDYIGMKVLVEPMDTAILEERIVANKSTYQVIEKAYGNIIK